MAGHRGRGGPEPGVGPGAGEQGALAIGGVGLGDHPGQLDTAGQGLVEVLLGGVDPRRAGRGLRPELLAPGQGGPAPQGQLLIHCRLIAGDYRQQQVAERALPRGQGHQQEIVGPRALTLAALGEPQRPLAGQGRQPHPPVRLQHQQPAPFQFPGRQCPRVGRARGIEGQVALALHPSREVGPAELDQEPGLGRGLVRVHPLHHQPHPGIERLIPPLDRSTRQVGETLLAQHHPLRQPPTGPQQGGLALGPALVAQPAIRAVGELDRPGGRLRRQTVGLLRPDGELHSGPTPGGGHLPSLRVRVGDNRPIVEQLNRKQWSGQPSGVQTCSWGGHHRRAAAASGSGTAAMDVA